MGFLYLMKNLPQERLSIAVVAAAAMESALDMTIQYCRDRKAFGKPIGSFQNTRFVLAELATETNAGPVLVDKFIEMLNDGKLTVAGSGHGQVVDHRGAGQADRPVPAAARRLRLHEGVPDRQGVHGLLVSRPSTAAPPRS